MPKLIKKTWPLQFWLPFWVKSGPTLAEAGILPVRVQQLKISHRNTNQFRLNTKANWHVIFNIFTSIFQIKELFSVLFSQLQVNRYFFSTICCTEAVFHFSSPYFLLCLSLSQEITQDPCTSSTESFSALLCLLQAVLFGHPM